MDQELSFEALTNLRERAGVSQAQAAQFFGMTSPHSYKSIMAWEQGKSKPKVPREEFIRYLLDKLKLKEEPETFNKLWKTLANRWKWEPLSDEELRRLGAQQDASKLPPNIESFVGRETELAYYRKQLEANGIVVITGFPGVGKTWLATKLANMLGSSLCWFECYRGEHIEKIYWGLAEFLDKQGKGEPLRQIQMNMDGWEHKPKSIIDNIFRLLGGHNYLICIDNFHYIRDAEEKLRNQESEDRFGEFVGRLTRMIQYKQIKLIVTAQSRMDLGQQGGNIPLGGLTLIDTQLLLESHKIDLDETSLMDIHTILEGNSQLLALAIQVLEEKKNPKQLINDLRQLGVNEIKDFLLDEIDRQLTREEQIIMEGVAVLLEYSTAAAIEATSNGNNVRRLLTYLSSRYFLETTISGSEEQYDEHELVRTFYYNHLDDKERVLMHQRAGEHYEKRARPVDFFKAALHYQRARETYKAAEMAARDVRSQLYQGRAGILQEIFDEALTDSLDDLLRVQVTFALGQIYTYRQEVGMARVKYEESIALLEFLPDSLQVRRLWADVSRELAVLLRNSAAAEALNTLKRGLEKLGSIDKQREADLLIQFGIVQRRLGNSEMALTTIQRALTLLPDKPSRSRLLALLNLGNQLYHRGDVISGASYWQKAVAMADDLGDQINGLSIRNNLGIHYHTTGRWSEALQNYQQANDMAQKLGNFQKRAEALLNLGVLYAQMGEDQLAKEQFAQSLELARQVNDNETIVLCLAHRAELQIEDYQPFDLIMTDLEPAIQLAHESELIHLSPFLNYVKASAWLNRTPPTPATLAQAISFARAALDSARQQKMRQEEGFSLRILGQVHAASGDLAAAIASFTQSEARLTDIPYYLARTQAAWGDCLIAHGKDEEGKVLLQKARSTLPNWTQNVT